MNLEPPNCSILSLFLRYTSRNSSSSSSSSSYEEIDSTLFSVPISQSDAKIRREETKSEIRKEREEEEGKRSEKSVLN